MDLAFDREGNPFRFRSQTRKLRPRRWKHAGQRGTCAAVLDPDGEQLLIDADADFAEFRAAVRNSPGFYRLDQCDGDGIAIEDAPPAYVTIESARNASMQSESDPRDAIIRDLAQALADSNRTLTEQFSSVMNATAVVLRAADGAGLPRREPPPPPASAPDSPDDDEDSDDDEDHDDADEHRPEPAEKLWAIIEQMLPSIQMWLAAMASRTSPTPAAAPSTPELAAPPALAATSAAPIVDGVAAGPSAPEFPRVAATVSADSAVSSAIAPNVGSSTPPTAPSADPIPAVAAPSAAIATAVSAPLAEPRNASPSAEPTAQQWAHLMAIRTRLAPRELAIAERVLVRMTTEMRRQWLAQLSAHSVDEATEIVRSLIPRPAPTAPTDSGKHDGSRGSR